jgi:hypothetical protein
MSANPRATPPAGLMKLRRYGIGRRLRIGEALHLGVELVVVEDPHLVEVLERADAFPALAG